jgi:hypothetical protein
MASALEKVDSLEQKCDQLTQIATKLNKTVSDAITTATNEMETVLTSIKGKIEETMSTVTSDTNDSGSS